MAQPSLVWLPAFLPNKKKLEERVREGIEKTPFLALLPQDIVADDHVVAKIGSVEDDLLGRLLREAVMDLGLSEIWLERALSKLFAAHNVLPKHVACWGNRLGIFDDITFVPDGVEAWYVGDLVKAVHVLVPQAESGLRTIVGQLGGPATKAHPTVAGASVALTMGDILYSDELAEASVPTSPCIFARSMPIRAASTFAIRWPTGSSNLMILPSTRSDC